MRARLTVLLLVALVVGAFAALNWSEFTRPTQLSFGAGIIDAPLGITMLAILAVAMVLFFLAGAAAETRNLIESRHYAREIERHRELSDRAEASRFTDLRTYLDAQLRELRQRDAIAATELEKARLENQREIRSQLDAMNRVLATRLSELENHLDARFAGRDPVVTERVVERRERV
jgi:uncharacterized integral membrane protein